MANKSLTYYMRAIHRVLGYLTVGLVIVYAVSGIVLIHRGGNFMKKQTHIEQTLQPGLTGQQLGEELNLRKFKVQEETETAVVFAEGTYDKTTGEASYTKTELVSPINRLVRLHVVSDKQNIHVAWLTTIFGAALLLLALTSLFMYKPAAKQFRTNMIYTVAGVVFATLLVLLL